MEMEVAEPNKYGPLDLAADGQSGDMQSFDGFIAFISTEESTQLGAHMMGALYRDKMLLVFNEENIKAPLFIEEANAIGSLELVSFTPIELKKMLRVVTVFVEHVSERKLFSAALKAAFLPQEEQLSFFAPGEHFFRLIAKPNPRAIRGFYFISLTYSRSRPTHLYLRPSYSRSSWFIILVTPFHTRGSRSHPLFHLVSM